MRWCSLLVVTLVLLMAIVRLSYKEDIRDFLPLSEADRERMETYQDMAGMNRLFVIFESAGDAEQVTQAITRFVDAVFSLSKGKGWGEADTADWCRDLQTSFDLESLSELADFVYRNIPLFLRPDDYVRMDSLLALPTFMDERMEDDQSALMLPTGSLVTQNIGRDPLGLFTAPLEGLQQSQQQMRFEVYDGHVFTHDMSRAIVMLSSPFGSSETDMNARLIDLLEDAILVMQERFPEIKAHVAGGPQIAVGNARQIVRDSILAVSLAAVLILALLLYAFRSFRDIALIALSVGWGWLFALGGMALVHDSISMIVVGISSIIIGIAINYPLHFISHVQHQPDIRQALREITKPLLVGNITTVGAFLALVPLDSLALRDLGLFASFLLVGTILFVLVWLPNLFLTLSKGNAGVRLREAAPDFLTRLASVQIGRKGWVVAGVIILTLIFGYFSLSVEFDTDLSNINYMTAGQKADIDFFGGGQEAPDTPILQVPSASEQAVRLKRWQEWVAGHPQLLNQLDDAAARHGFAEDAFFDFKAIISSEYTTHGVDYFQPLTSQYLAGNSSWANKELASLNSSVAETLSDDFNYIGWVCSSIVFLFLWLSFRRFELAVISFIPMAVSWIWILGLMSLLGIKFNIVNIILATFIFGQGDDYTIFMTEGCVSEYEQRRPVLVSYKRSIFLSALIMFIGIGTLIFAKHPALHSLAEVTIIGMFSVVLMAYLIPPFLFKWWMKLRNL